MYSAKGPKTQQSKHCKKSFAILPSFTVPSRDICDIPAGDGKITNLFYSVVLPTGQKFD